MGSQGSQESHFILGLTMGLEQAPQHFETLYISWNSQVIFLSAWVHRRNQPMLSTTLLLSKSSIICCLVLLGPFSLNFLLSKAFTNSLSPLPSSFSLPPLVCPDVHLRHQCRMFFSCEHQAQEKSLTSSESPVHCGYPVMSQSSCYFPGVTPRCDSHCHNDLRPRDWFQVRLKSHIQRQIV